MPYFKRSRLRRRSSGWHEESFSTTVDPMRRRVRGSNRVRSRLTCLLLVPFVLTGLGSAGARVVCCCEALGGHHESAHEGHSHGLAQSGNHDHASHDHGQANEPPSRKPAPHEHVDGVLGVCDAADAVPTQKHPATLRSNHRPSPNTFKVVAATPLAPDSQCNGASSAPRHKKISPLRGSSEPSLFLLNRSLLL